MTPEEKKSIRHVGRPAEGYHEGNEIRLAPGYLETDEEGWSDKDFKPISMYDKYKSDDDEE